MITFPNIGYIGRLGNQMFQYAAFISISKQHNIECSLLNSNIELYKCFNIPTKVSSYYNNDTISPNGFIVKNPFVFKIEIDGNDEFNKIFSTQYDKKFLDNNFIRKSITGFFQNYKYFKDIESELKKHFIFNKKYINIADYYIKNFSSNKIISLHIRRTDYLNSSVLNNLDLNYYENALTYFEKSIPVLVFSDDPEWCQNQKLFKNNRFKIIRTNNTYIDLCLMSKCDYHIIANSSFSWWGSWLAQSKKTICPKQWFSENYNFLDSDGLRLPNWISI